MFYRTQIKTVTDYGAIDMQGKKLSFIGYLPVKAGDWVFTDGKIIFGNVPPRGSTLIANEPSGIPVLGDDLRGYFSRNGNFKNYPVKQDTWLVNSDKKFAHGASGLGDEKIIDAEFAADGSTFTVWKKTLQFKSDDSNSEVLFYHYYNSYFMVYGKRDYYSMLNLERRTRGAYTYVSNYRYWTLTGDFDYIKNTSPTVTQATWDWEGGVFTAPIFTPKTQPLIRDCALIIKKDDEEIKTLYLSKLAKYAEETAVNSIAVPLPVDASTPNIVTLGELSIQSRANLKNFKIKPDGSWESLFVIEIGAECTYDRQTDFPTDDTVDSIRYATSAGHTLYLFKVNSAGESAVLAERSVFMPLWLIKNIQFNAIMTHDATEPSIDKTTFPYTAMVTTSASHVGGQDTFWLTTYDVYDSHNWPRAPAYNKSLSRFAENFTFPVQDEYYAKFSNMEEYFDKWKLDGIFDAENNQVCKEFLEPYNYHKGNLSFVPLRNGGGLFGVRKDEEREVNGVLYKIDKDGNSQQVGSGLKNFRLRELRKINKARH